MICAITVLVAISQIRHTNETSVFKIPTRHQHSQPLNPLQLQVYTVWTDVLYKYLLMVLVMREVSKWRSGSRLPAVQFLCFVTFTELEMLGSCETSSTKVAN